MHKIIDIPSPINLQDSLDAIQWANEVSVKDLIDKSFLLIMYLKF